MLLLFAAALEPFAAVDAGGWVSGCGSGCCNAVNACCCAVEEGAAGMLLDANFQPNSDGAYKQEGMLSRACKGWFALGHKDFGLGNVPRSQCDSWESRN